MESYSLTLRALGQRVRQLRLLRNLQQDDLASRAGLSSGTVQRLEHSGKTSLENALRVAMALGAEQGFENLFELPQYESIDAVLTRPQVITRQRVRKKSK